MKTIFSSMSAATLQLPCHLSSLWLTFAWLLNLASFVEPHSCDLVMFWKFPTIELVQPFSQGTMYDLQDFVVSPRVSVERETTFSSHFTH